MRYTRYRTLAIVMLSLVCISCGTLKSDLERRPEFKVKDIEEIASVEATPSWLWQDKGSEVGRHFVSRIDANNKIWRADTDGVITCLSLDNGASCGRIDLATPLEAGVGLGKTLVAVISKDGQLIVVNKNNGSVVSRVDLNRRVYNPPVIEDSIVIVRPSVSEIIAIDAFLGTELWRYDAVSSRISFDAPIESVVHEYEVFSGLSQGQMVTQDLVDGQLLWKAQLAPSAGLKTFDIASDIVAPPVIFASQLYISVVNEGITAYALGSRQVIFEAQIPVRGTPTVDTDLLYVQTESGHIVALDSLTGQVQWQQGDLRNRNLSNMVLAGGHLWVADDDGNLFLLRRNDGSIDYLIKIDDEPVRLSARDDYIVVESAKGNIGILKTSRVAIEK